MSNDAQEFGSSKLGTREYWDNRYEMEIENYEDNEDIGEIWFGENVADKVVSWVNKKCQGDHNKPILDVGCGNGHLLFDLEALGHTCLVGSDYSQKAVDLAKEIAKDRCSNVESIKFVVSDLLLSDGHEELCSVLGKFAALSDGNQVGKLKYFLVLDKGTFDAISLKPKDSDIETSDNTDGKEKKDVDLDARSAYINTVRQLVEPKSGVFLITSCNWTEDELVHIFTEWFEPVDRIAHKFFTFGGVKGQVVSTVAFKLKAQ